MLLLLLAWLCSARCAWFLHVFDKAFLHYLLHIRCDMAAQVQARTAMKTVTECHTTTAAFTKHHVRPRSCMSSVHNVRLWLLLQLPLSHLSPPPLPCHQHPTPPRAVLHPNRQISLYSYSCCSTQRDARHTHTPSPRRARRTCTPPPPSPWYLQYVITNTTTTHPPPPPHPPTHN